MTSPSYFTDVLDYIQTRTYAEVSHPSPDATQLTTYLNAVTTTPRPRRPTSRSPSRADHRLSSPPGDDDAPLTLAANLWQNVLAPLLGVNNSTPPPPSNAPTTTHHLCRACYTPLPPAPSPSPPHSPIHTLTTAFTIESVVRTWLSTLTPNQNSPDSEGGGWQQLELDWQSPSAWPTPYLRESMCRLVTLGYHLWQLRRAVREVHAQCRVLYRGCLPGLREAVGEWVDAVVALRGAAGGGGDRVQAAEEVEEAREGAEESQVEARECVVGIWGYVRELKTLGAVVEEDLGVLKGVWLQGGGAQVGCGGCLDYLEGMVDSFVSCLWEVEVLVLEDVVMLRRVGIGQMSVPTMTKEMERVMGDGERLLSEIKGPIDRGGNWCKVLDDFASKHRMLSAESYPINES